MHEPSVKRRKTAQSPTPSAPQRAIFSAPHAPLVFSSYLKLILHACGILVFILAILFVINASRREIDGRVAHMLQELEEEKMNCAQRFRDNQCDLYAHKHFFGSFCNQWEQCMKSDLRRIGRAKVTMTVYGEMINALVEPLTFKAMHAKLTICLLLFGVFIGSCLVA